MDNDNNNEGLTGLGALLNGKELNSENILALLSDPRMMALFDQMQFGYDEDQDRLVLMWVDPNEFAKNLEKGEYEQQEYGKYITYTHVKGKQDQPVQIIISKLQTEALTSPEIGSILSNLDPTLIQYVLGMFGLGKKGE
jgi:hypothetical protein